MIESELHPLLAVELAAKLPSSILEAMAWSIFLSFSP